MNEKLMIHHPELGVEKAVTPGAARALQRNGWQEGPLPGGPTETQTVEVVDAEGATVTVSAAAFEASRSSAVDSSGDDAAPVVGLVTDPAPQAGAATDPASGARSARPSRGNTTTPTSTQEVTP